MTSVVRVSILRCTPGIFTKCRRMMAEFEDALRPGIQAMPGLVAYYAGADEATSSLHNTSVWETLEHARQMDTFQPMLDSAKQFAAIGATFERPIMNYETLWHFVGRESHDRQDT